MNTPSRFSITIAPHGDHGLHIEGVIHDPTVNVPHVQVTCPVRIHPEDVNVQGAIKHIVNDSTLGDVMTELILAREGGEPFKKHIVVMEKSFLTKGSEKKEHIDKLLREGRSLGFHVVVLCGYQPLTPDEIEGVSLNMASALNTVKI